MVGESRVVPLPEGTTWVGRAPQRATLSRACGTGLALTSIWFCASLEPQEVEKKKKKGNSFQVAGEHVSPWGCNRMEIETGSGGHGGAGALTGHRGEGD